MTQQLDLIGHEVKPRRIRKVNGRMLRRWRLKQVHQVDQSPLTQRVAANYYSTTTRSWRRWEHDQHPVPPWLAREVWDRALPVPGYCWQSPA